MSVSLDFAFIQHDGDTMSMNTKFLSLPTYLVTWDKTG